MKIEDVTLPGDADLRMVVAALLTVATCTMRPEAEAEAEVCALYERYRTAAGKKGDKKALQTWEKLGPS